MINRKSGLLFAVITALCFATHEPVSKLFANEIDPYAINAIRFFVGSLVLLPFSVREIVKKRIRLTLKDFIVMGSLGVLFICVSTPLLQVSVKIADSPSVVAIIFSSNSIMTIILSALFLGNKITTSKGIGILLCVIGVIVSADLSKGTNIESVIMALVSAASFSIYTVLCKKYMTRLSGVIQSGISFFIGSIILIIILLVSGIEVTGGITANNVFPLMYVAVVVSGIGYWAYFAAMRIGGAQTAAIAFLIKPIITPFATFFVNGIKPDSSIIIAVILVVVGASLAGGTAQKLFVKNK